MFLNGQIYFHVTAYTSHDSQEVLVFLVYETLTDLKKLSKTCFVRANKVQDSFECATNNFNKRVSSVMKLGTIWFLTVIFYDIRQSQGSFEYYIV